MVQENTSQPRSSRRHNASALHALRRDLPAWAIARASVGTGRRGRNEDRLLVSSRPACFLCASQAEPNPRGQHTVRSDSSRQTGRRARSKATGARSARRKAWRRECEGDVRGLSCASSCSATGQASVRHVRVGRAGPVADFVFRPPQCSPGSSGERGCETMLGRWGGSGEECQWGATDTRESNNTTGLEVSRRLGSCRCEVGVFT